MEQLPYEIIQKIILGISSCSTKDASCVCKKWKKILYDNFLIIGDSKIIINDTFMLNKMLCETFSRKFGFCQNYRQRRIETLLEGISIEKIINSKCLTYIAKFLISLHYKSKLSDAIIAQLCINNDQIAIKFYTIFFDCIYLPSKKEISGYLLSLCLRYNSFVLIDYFVTKTENFDVWIDYVSVNYENNDIRMKLSLDYLVSIKAINLRFFHDKMNGNVIAKYIEEKYF